MLPSIGFTYTITDSFTLDQSGNLKANESTDLNVSTLGIIEEAVLVGLLNQFLGGVTFFGGILGAGAADPHEAGVGSALAANWPDNNRGVLTSTSPPLTGKVIFTWSKLNVDTSGLRTLGTWNLALRSPQVRIVGPTVLTFKESAGSVIGGYTFNANSDLNGVASVVWGGDTKGTARHTEVNFGAPGDYSIQVSVTDDDNVTATAAMNVTVKETKNGGRPA